MSRLIKDHDCMYCEKMYDCNGKPENLRNKPCLYFEEREDLKSERDNSNRNG